MYSSIEGGQMTSTISNVDLEEMLFCLAKALVVNIQNGDEQYEPLSLSLIDEEDENYSKDEFDSSEDEYE